MDAQTSHRYPLLHVPAKARTKLPDNLESGFVAEEKLDGSRYLLYIGCDPYGRSRHHETFNTLLSRRESSKDGLFVDKSRNLPHITEHPFFGLTYTVLDGEVTLPGQDFYVLNGIMNSLPEASAAAQEKHGRVIFNVFDVLRIDGKDVTDKPFGERRIVLECIMRDAQAHRAMRYMNLLPQFEHPFEEHFRRIVENGGEGLIIKNLDSPYGKGWSKMKKSHDISCVVMGYKPGKGKYEGQIGALQLGVWYGGVLTEVGFASGMDDDLRKAITDNPKAYLGKVVDIFAQQIQTNTQSVGRLRHPTFYRFRDDMGTASVTYDKLIEDFTLGKAQSKRER